MKKISILGGGVSGLTTAIVLSLSGFRVEVIARDRLDQIDPKARYKNKKMASLHGVASVLTHTVNTPNLSRWLTDSQKIFGLLQALATFGVRKQRHFEIFEEQSLAIIPEYASSLHNFNPLPFRGQGLQEAPRSAEDKPIWGWYFDCFFVETGEYFRRLIQLFEKLGGVIKSQEISSIENLEADIIVNCMGLEAGNIFKDPSPQIIYRGALVYVETPLLLEKWTQQLTSYNYVLQKGKYTNAHTGQDGDLYFYPRADGVVLGGTREEGRYDEQGKWVGEYMNCDYISVGEEEVPEILVKENINLIKRLTGHDISSCKMSAAYGLRSTRKAGVRLEAENIKGRTVFHNYGHGGSGVTLSWGCAVEVARMLGISHMDNELVKLSREVELLSNELKSLVEPIS